jgi:hypothetical protein
MRWLTKTMTKKVREAPHSSPPLGLLAVPRGVGLVLFGEKDFIFYGVLHFGYIQFVSNCIQNKTATDGGSFKYSHQWCDFSISCTNGASFKYHLA